MSTNTLASSHPNTRTQSLSLSPVLLWLALGGVILHVVLNGQYGFHRDELDILMNARQLAWGYVAYPPLTPAIAWLELAVFGPSLIGMRLLSAVGQGVTMILAALMARDFGGGKAAQVMAAVAAFIAPIALTAGTLIQYMAFDYLWWVAAAFCLVRRLRTDDPRWWLGVGAAFGLGLMTKYTIGFWALGLAASLLLTPLRRDLRSRWLWAGAGLALLIFSPNLVWQIQHGFISLKFLGAIHARDIQWGRTDSFLVDQLYVANNPLTLPLWVAGLVFVLHPAGKRFRALGWMFLATFGLLFISKGRGYYVAPAYVMLVAAGAAWWEGWLAQRPAAWRQAGQGALWGLVGVGAVVGVVLVKPVVPINSALWPITSGVNHEVVEMIGWPDLAEQVAAIYATIPAAQKPRTAIMAGNYGEAGALDLYGPALGLPRVISGANSLWARGYGDPPPETLIVVGFESSQATSMFSGCQLAGEVTNAYRVMNEESTRHTGLYLCGGPRRPWAALWPDMQWYQ